MDGDAGRHAVRLRNIPPRCCGEPSAFSAVFMDTRKNNVCRRWRSVSPMSQNPAQPGQTSPGCGVSGYAQNRLYLGINRAVKWPVTQRKRRFFPGFPSENAVSAFSRRKEKAGAAFTKRLPPRPFPQTREGARKFSADDKLPASFNRSVGALPVFRDENAERVRLTRAQLCGPCPERIAGPLVQSE